MKEAFVWGVNLCDLDDRGAPTDMHVCEGLMYPNIYYAEEKGAVYWDHGWPTSEEHQSKSPLTGYMYIGNEVYDVLVQRRGTICFRCTIEKILSPEELRQDDYEQQYVPPWREQCLWGEWRDGSEHDVSPSWFKLSNIIPLSRGYNPREFGIERDYVRGRALIEDMDWR